jgi:spore coat polysaccharide biosynthesis protein SpsF
MKEVLGKPLLSYLIERLQRCQQADKVVVATTTNPLDQQIVDFCRKEKTPCYRGSEKDVLDRYFRAAKHYGADIVVRITGDCPLADPNLIDAMLVEFLQSYPKCDYLSNVITRTFPRGLDVEIMTMECLEEEKRYALSQEELEHVTTYILRHPDRFATHSITTQRDLSPHRWTVDTQEDFTLIRNLIEALYPHNPEFTMEDVLEILDANPEWIKINSHILQKQGGGIA